MEIKKITTSTVEVYKAIGKTMEIAFKNLKQEHSFEDYNLEINTHTDLTLDKISTGTIYKESKRLYSKYINNEISEFTILGALYNHKPIIKTGENVLVHNIVNKGTKKWETINSYRKDSGEEVYQDTSTKAEATEKSIELAVKYNETINVVASKRLVGMDGILVVAEWLDNKDVDEDNCYVFWKYANKVTSKTIDDIYEESTEKDDVNQLSIKFDIASYCKDKILNN